MRKLILDTETTGLDYENDRIIEIACLEMINDSHTGKKYHEYYGTDGIIISDQAEQIHGLNNKFLKDFKTFDQRIMEFLDFVDDSPLIIHNAQFDISMINSALKRCGKKIINYDSAICTLEMSKKKFPGSKNNLNALCRRFDISLEDRVKHSALTDCYLLLQVYTELLGGRQGKLGLSVKERKGKKYDEVSKSSSFLDIKVSDEEQVSHSKMLEKIDSPIWNKF